MRIQTKIALAVLAIVLGLLAQAALAQTPVRSAGIGVRGSYWKMNDGPAQIIVTNGDGYSSVDVGNGGGWIFFLSRMADQTFFEFSLGGVGSVKAQTRHYHGEDVDVSAVTPLLFGLRQNLLSPYNENAMQPYLALGAGPYWLHDISVTERAYEDNVAVHSKVRGGAYAGGGMNFMMTSWLGLNFDVKYHFVDFNVNHDYSGFEYGLGLVFMWGNYKGEHRR